MRILLRQAVHASTPGLRVAYVLVLLLVSLLLSSCMPSPLTIRGEVKQYHENDTLTIEYDLELKSNYYPIDSLHLQLQLRTDTCPAESLIFAQPDSIARGDRSLYYNYGRISGVFRFPLADSVRVIKYGIRGPRTSYVREYNFDTPVGNGLLFGLGMTVFDRSVYPERVRQIPKSTAFHFEMGWIHYRPSFTGIFSLSTNSINAIFNIEETEHSFSFTQYGRFGIRYHALDRGKFRPSPVVAIKYERFNVHLDLANDHTLQELGAELGGIIESDFERFGYSYSSSLGGYHRIDLLACSSSGPTTKFGTMYSFYHGSNVRLFMMRYYAELPFNNHQLLRRDNRSFIQKTLSYGFAAPVYWFFRLLMMGAIVD